MLIIDSSALREIGRGHLSYKVEEVERSTGGGGIDQMVTGARPATMVAVAGGGARWGRWAEREGEGGKAGEQQELTSITWPWPATHGEAGLRGDGARSAAAERGRTAAMVVVEGAPARFSRRGGAALQGGDDGAVVRSSGGRK